mmetsp:Transcript_41354/g.82872  ORF Transcript_41354/g.82872 Transcript_41354/m.82872 type:complete len:290 (-) Transcript_41354:299-1168(-)
MSASRARKRRVSSITSVTLTRGAASHRETYSTSVCSAVPSGAASPTHPRVSKSATSGTAGALGDMPTCREMRSRYHPMNAKSMSTNLEGWTSTSSSLWSTQLPPSSHDCCKAREGAGAVSGIKSAGTSSPSHSSLTCDGVREMVEDRDDASSVTEALLRGLGPRPKILAIGSTRRARRGSRSSSVASRPAPLPFLFASHSSLAGFLRPAALALATASRSRRSSVSWSHLACASRRSKRLRACAVNRRISGPSSRVAGVSRKSLRRRVRSRSGSVEKKVTPLSMPPATSP